MKNISIAIFLGLCAVGLAYSTSAKIQGVGTPACVNVSSTTWTAVPSTTTIKAGRIGIIISAPPSTVGAFNIGMTSNTIQLPGYTTSQFVIQMEPGEWVDLEVSQFVYIFGVSTHTLTATQPFCYQEYTPEWGR